jgi:membrane protein
MRFWGFTVWRKHNRLKAMKRDRSFLRRLWGALGSALRALLNENTPRDAAAISYFGMISLFPSILLLITMADTSLGWIGEPREKIIQRLVSLFPASRQFLSDNLIDLADPSPALTVACIVVVIWCTSWICAFIENALNRAWNVSRRRPFWENRVRGMALLAVGGMCLLISVAFNAFVSAVQTQSAARIPALAEPAIRWFWSFIPLAAGFLIAVFVFTLIYKLMPGCHISLFEAWCGSVAASIIWELGSYIFVKVLSHFNYGRVYGKAGAVIALLAWVYTSSFIMLYGAHFTAQLHQSGD